LQGAHSSSSTDSEAEALERDKAVALSKQLQSELDEASSTLCYMEKLLKALKLHKKASEAAQVALKQSQEEGTALANKLTSSEEASRQLQRHIQEQDKTIHELQDRLLAMGELQVSLRLTTAKLMVTTAIGHAKTSDAKKLTKDIEYLQKAQKRLNKKLEDTQQELVATKGHFVAEKEKSGSLQQALGQKVEEIGAVKHQLDLETGNSSRLTQKLERERAATLAANTALDKAKVKHEQAVAALQSDDGKMQERCAILNPVSYSHILMAHQ
jgi:chromosome segregation ATPase